MAIASKLNHEGVRVYCICGDGELQEGQIWEAAMTSSHYKLDNLCLIVDNNNLQIDGKVNEVMSIYPIDEKFRSFGFQVIHIDGHDIEEIMKDAHLECGVYSVSHSPIIQNFLLQLIAEYNQTKTVSSANGLLLYILYMLGKQVNNSNTSNDYLQNAITYITANYTREIHITELANACNLSKSHFMYLFKEELGMTPLEYRNRNKDKEEPK